MSTEDIIEVSNWVRNLNPTVAHTRREWEHNALVATNVAVGFDAIERIAKKLEVPLPVRRDGRVNRNAVASGLAESTLELCGVVNEIIANQETDLPSGVMASLSEACVKAEGMAREWRGRMGIED